MRTFLEAAVLACAVSASVARAEQAEGVFVTVLSQATFPGTKVKAGEGKLEFEAEWKTAMNVVIRRHDYLPGGTTGWHTHPGPVFITVPAGGGTLTVYEYDGRNCTSFTLTEGEGYVDEGHAHMIRNLSGENAFDVSVIAAPVGVALRDNIPPPSGCGN